MIALVTDSTCDLGPAQLSQLGVRVVPLGVHLEGKRWLDWEELDPDVLYAKMQDGATATTSPPSVADFAATYRPLLATHDAVLSLHLSGHLSETAANARTAAEELGASDRVHVYDSGFATAPLAELVLRAQRLAGVGADLDAVVRDLDRLRGEMLVQFTVQSLEYLRRGGRLSRAQAFLGSILGVRPVLTFEEGRIVPVRRVRAQNVAQDMIAQAEARFGSRPVEVSIVYAGRDRDRIDALRKTVEGSRLVVRSGRIQILGAVVGAYTGPGAFGFCVLPHEA